MPMPSWHLESMYDALWNGEYELISVEKSRDGDRLNFDPYAYPYGGTGSMVALIECFGHRVLGVEDGTGYQEYVPVNRWQPKNQQM